MFLRKTIILNEYSTKKEINQIIDVDICSLYKIPEMSLPLMPKQLKHPLAPFAYHSKTQKEYPKKAAEKKNRDNHVLIEKNEHNNITAGINIL